MAGASSRWTAARSRCGRAGVWLPLLLGLLATGACALQTTTCDTTERERAAVAREALALLEDEYDVIEGKLSFPPFAQPAGRYGLVSFDGRQVNPPALCEITDSVKTPYGNGLCNFTSIVGPRDAIVGLFCTPPPVKYFSLRSYVGFRFRPSAWLPAVELGDPASNLVINTTARLAPDDEGQAQGPFGKTALFVSTADGVTARHVRQAFKGAGWPEVAMNLDVLAAEKVYFRDERKPWLLDRSDGVVINYRVSSPVNRTEVEPYFKSSYQFYLLRPKAKGRNGGGAGSLRPNRPRVPLTTPPLRPRATGETEDDLLAPLEELEEAVIDYMSRSRGAKLHARFPMEHITPDYEKCLTDPTYYPIAESVPAWGLQGFATCGFFTRDGIYSFFARPDVLDYNDLTFPANRSYVLLGVNQVLRKKAVYSNIFMTAVAAAQQPGRTVNFSAPALEGSATWYKPDLPQSPELFAQLLTRDDCHKRPPATQEDTFEPFCTTVPESVLNATEFIYVVERKYLSPVTKIGPDPAEVLVPRVLVFETPAMGLGEGDGMGVSEEA